MPVFTMAPRRGTSRISATFTESTLPGIGYTLTIRKGPKVTRERYNELGAALGALERAGVEIEGSADARPEGGTFMRKITPVQQVVGRLELSGAGRLRAGVDVRGDGSSEAYTGRVRRRLIEGRPGESAYDALRRQLGDGAKRP